MKEAQTMLGFPIEAVDIDLPEIQSLQYEDIVKQKAIDAFQIIKKPLIVDDAGLSIDTWNGFPGPLVKHIYKAGGEELLLKMLKNDLNRKAKTQALIGFYDGREVMTFMGECQGTIAQQPKGTQGWGFDPIFIPDGYTKTFAELGPEVKNTISHRRIALEKLRMYLQEKELTFSS